MKNFRSYDDVIRDHHTFLPEDNEEENENGESRNERWEKDFSRKFEESLFREYALVDLSKYEENKVGMRWRTSKDVLGQKGEGKYCGEVNCLDEGKVTTETYFQYMEKKQPKRALVKLFLCEECFQKLNEAKKKKEEVVEDEPSSEIRSSKKRKRKDTEILSHEQDDEKIDLPTKKKRKID